MGLGFYISVLATNLPKNFSISDYDKPRKCITICVSQALHALGTYIHVNETIVVDASI